MSSNEFNNSEKEILLGLAKESISYGVEKKRPLPINIEEFPPHLQEKRASFVTVLTNGQLRGCIGALEALQPLAKDVSDHAYAAAFQDPRFPPMQAAEVESVEVKIAVLSPPEPLEVRIQADLYKVLRPKIDGLIIQENLNKATFLPSVWEQLPEPEDFVVHLLRKAGLRTNHWSDEMKVWRYTTEEF